MAFESEQDLYFESEDDDDFPPPVPFYKGNDNDDDEIPPPPPEEKEDITPTPEQKKVTYQDLYNASDFTFDWNVKHVPSSRGAAEEKLLEKIKTVKDAKSKKAVIDYIFTIPFDRSWNRPQLLELVRKKTVRIKLDDPFYGERKFEFADFNSSYFNETSGHRNSYILFINPNLTLAETKQILEEYAQDFDSQDWKSLIKNSKEFSKQIQNLVTTLHRKLVH